MKDQYFGDINDYRKYGLLRALCGRGNLSSTACWMLTPSDGRTDGRFTDYLQRPDKWSKYDPDLYEFLRNVLGQGTRKVRAIEQASVLPTLRFFSDLVPDTADARTSYFRRLLELAHGTALVFFDPDNGIEVRSVRFGRSGSSKYIYWQEIIETFAAGHSLLVYQHFPREKRQPFIARLAGQFIQAVDVQAVYSFRTSSVVFFLVPQPSHEYSAANGTERIRHIWGSQIRMEKHQASV